MFTLSENYWFEHYFLIDEARLADRERARQQLNVLKAHLGEERYQKFLAACYEKAQQESLLPWQRWELDDLKEKLGDGNAALPLTPRQWCSLIDAGATSTVADACAKAINVLYKASQLDPTFETLGAPWLYADPHRIELPPKLREKLKSVIALRVRNLSVLSSLSLLRFAVQLRRKVVEECGARALRDALGRLSKAHAGVALPSLELLGYLEGTPIDVPEAMVQEVACLITSAVCQNRAHFDADGRWSLSHLAISLVHGSFNAAMKVLTEVEEFLHGPKTVWWSSLIDPPGRVWPAVLLRDVFGYLDANAQRAALHLELLGYGYQSTQEVPGFAKLEDFETPRAHLRFRRQSAIDWLFENASATWPDGLPVLVRGKVHSALWDVDPAVRKAAAALLAKIRSRESVAELRALLDREKDSESVREDAERALRELAAPPGLG